MTRDEVRWFVRGVVFGAGIAWIIAAGLARCAHGQEIATSDPAVICGKVDGMSYSRQHRALLLEDERRADFARYSVPWSEHRNYEDDHIVPLCLGGADTPKNRRPQRCDLWSGMRCMSGPAADKDKIEERACSYVCREIRRPDGGDYEEYVLDAIERDEIADWQAVFAKWRY